MRRRGKSEAAAARQCQQRAEVAVLHDELQLDGGQTAEGRARGGDGRIGLLLLLLCDGGGGGVQSGRSSEAGRSRRLAGRVRLFSFALAHGDDWRQNERDEWSGTAAGVCE